MKLIIIIITFLIIFLSAIQSCNLETTFNYPSVKYKNESIDFLHLLMNNKYDECALEFYNLNSNDPIISNKLYTNLKLIKNNIENEFGVVTDYKYLNILNKSDQENKIPDSINVVLIQISNENYFGIIKFDYNNKNNKILDLELLDIFKPIPDLSLFYITCTIYVLVLIFNLSLIFYILKTKMKYKLWWILSIIFINFPSLQYSALGILTMDLSRTLVPLGSYFNFSGYLDSFVTLSFPMGGLFFIWAKKINKGKYI